MAPCGRALHVRDRVSVLRALHHDEDLRRRRPPRDTGRAHGGRPRLSADESLDRLWPPLRGDRRSGSARRPHARGAIRLSPRRDLDRRRSRARRRRAGSRHPPRFGASRRPLARHHGARRDRASRGNDRARRDPRDNGGADRGARARRRQRTRVEPVGRRHDRAHDSDCTADGHPSSLDSARARARGERDRARAPRGRALRRPLGRCAPRRRRRVHALAPVARHHDHGVRLRCIRAPGVAAPRATRLPLGLREDRRRARARDRHLRGAPAAADARAHTLRTRRRADLRGHHLPLRLHHHRVRRDLRLPRAHRVGNDTQAAGT